MEGTFPNRSESVNSLLNPNLTCFANAGKYLRPASTCRMVSRPEPAGAISNGYQTIASPSIGALAMAEVLDWVSEFVQWSVSFVRSTQLSLELFSQSVD